MAMAIGLTQGQNLNWDPYCITDQCPSYLSNRQCCQDCLKEGESLGQCNKQNFHFPAVGWDGRYIGGCQPCPMNQYSHFCSCRECDPCGDWGYMSTPCFGDNQGDDCRVCRGPCGAGEEESHGCGRPDYNRDRQCVQCAAGKYRDNVNTQASCESCISPCSAGWKETRACTALYNRQCEQCPDNSYVVSTTTCVTCEPGKYRNAAKTGCNTCSSCTRSQSSTGCDGAVDRTCRDCGNYKYTLALNAATCAGCVYGYYDAGAGSCVKCDTSSCGWGNFRTCLFSDTKGGTRECGPCQGQKEDISTKCAAGYGVSTRCNGQNPAMVTCSECGPGTERAANAALVGDIQTCLACNPGYYKLATGTSPCTACSNKPTLNTQYIAWGSTTPSKTDCPW